MTKTDLTLCALLIAVLLAIFAYKPSDAKLSDCQAAPRNAPSPQYKPTPLPQPRTKPQVALLTTEE